MPDMEMADVTVIVNNDCKEKFDIAVEALKGLGLEVTSLNADTSTVDGSIETDKLKTLEHLPCVSYVRKVMTYSVEFPAGDPRDRNGGMGTSPDDLPPPSLGRRRMGKSYP